MPRTITGTIERITFHNEDNGYAVLRIRVSGQRDLITVVGTLSAVVAGEYIEAEGDWVHDPQHGLQFRADRLITTPPHSLEGIKKYLGSGLIKGIGPHYAKKIVEVFGERTLEVIDQSPTFLAEIKGIGPQRLQKIRQSWQEQKTVRQIIVFLQSHGLGTAKAIRIYKTYGEDAVEQVRANPYRLTSDIWGVGFKTADELANSIGIPGNSLLRARAAIRFILQELAKEGHVGFPIATLVQRIAEHPHMAGLEAEVIEQAIEDGRREGELIRDQPPPEATEINAEPWLYLRPLFLAELGVARAVQQLQHGEHPLPESDHQAAVGWVEGKMGLELAQCQREAILAALTEKRLIISGGPGVGKTTIVRGIIDIFAARRQRIGLCAPTGRAAKRLQESTGREARTIHRLLEFDPGIGTFKRNAESPLDLDLLVIDEASMVDMMLMNQLLRAIPRWACMVLVGDVDQLPSVGPGNVLRDLIASKTIRVVRLTQIFRQAQESWIVRAAHAVNAGQEPLSAPAGRTGDFYFVEASTPANILNKIVQMIRERIPARFGLDPIRDIQILSPRYKTELGVANLNHVLQGVLNPAGQTREILRQGVSFRVGDKVLQKINNYQREVFNGDIGRVATIDPEEQLLEVNYDGRLVPYEFGELDELTLAYATSVHKSQGSEYPAVIIPLHTQHYMMLQRNLLYTAMTRGKRLVVLVGSRKALALAVRQQDTARRFSLLQWRLHQSELSKEVLEAIPPELRWLHENEA